MMVKPVQDMLTIAKPYMILEDILTNYFDNPASIGFYSSRSARKKSHRHRDDPDKVMLGKYDRYTPLEVSREKFYQDCVNT